MTLDHCRDPPPYPLKPHSLARLLRLQSLHLGALLRLGATPLLDRPLPALQPLLVGRARDVSLGGGGGGRWSWDDDSEGGGPAVRERENGPKSQEMARRIEGKQKSSPFPT